MPVRLSSPRRLLPRLFAALMIGTALAGAPAALAPAAAQTVSVENLAFGPKEMSATIPRIDVEGSSLTQGELATLFQFKDIQSIASMLGRLNARSIRVPEIRLEQNLPAADGKTIRQTTIYRDLTMSDIAAGKARQVAIAGGTMVMEDANLGKVDGVFGRMSIDEVDFTGVVRFMIDKAVGGETAKTLYRNGVFDGMTMKSDKFSLSLGKMTFGEFRARPMKQPLMSIFELAKQMETAKASGAPPDPKATRQIFDFVIDMFDAFETTPATIENVRIDAQDDKKRPVAVSMAKATMGAMGKLRYPSLLFEKIDIKAADGAIRLGSFTFKGIDLNPTAAGLREAGDQPIEQWAATNWRKLIPSFEGFAMSGANIDVPDDKKPGQRIKASLGDYDLTLAAYVQGIPTNISTRLRNFVFEIPANTNESGLKDLLALGYKALDMSGALTAKWNENERVINFENVSALGAGMGAVAIKATVGNAIKELFTGDPTMMQIAAMGLTAKDIEIKVDNAGLFEKLVAREAQKQRKKPEDLRRDLGAMANIMIPGVLGGGTAAQTVANAVSAFMAKPGSLVLGVKAKDPAGISVGEAAMASGNPLSLLPKVDISARAN